MGILILMFFILIILIFPQVTQRQTLQQNRAWLKKQYGKKSVADLDSLEEIAILWKEFGSLTPEDEKIDDVTWNDLDMDEVYSRMNSCCSFTGEQYLYSCLHKLPKDEEYGSSLESKIKTLTADNEDRIEIQLQLLHLGKNNLGYYIPMFIHNLENNRIGNIRIFQVLQILLLLSVIPPLVFMNSLYWFGTGTLFLINLVLYTINKAKYEVFLNSLFSMIQLVKVGGELVRLNGMKDNENFKEMEQHLAIFKKLSRMVAGIEKKKAVSFSGDAIAMLYDYIVGSTLWDFTVYDKVCTILKDKQAEYMRLYELIGEIDAAISIASFRQSLPHYCLPAFVENRASHLGDYLYGRER